MIVDERLEVESDSSLTTLTLDPSDVVEPDDAQRQLPSEGSRRCMIYRK